jgi:hypothetical protein
MAAALADAIEAPERRSTPRAPLETWVEQSWRAGLVMRRARNVAVGGIALATSMPEPVGTLLDLEFSLPDGDATPISARGEIVSACCSGIPEIGIRFVALEESGRERLRAYVARLAA